MVKLPVKLLQNQHFLVTPINIRIIEITPSFPASDSGKQLCVYLILFDKTYHFKKRTCISCVILIMTFYCATFPLFLGQGW